MPIIILGDSRIYIWKIMDPYRLQLNPILKTNKIYYHTVT